MTKQTKTNAPDQKVSPQADVAAELPDSVLEKVAGGGDPNSQSANWEAKRDPTEHES